MFWQPDSGVSVVLVPRNCFGVWIHAEMVLAFIERGCVLVEAETRIGSYREIASVCGFTHKCFRLLKQLCQVFLFLNRMHFVV